MEELLGGRFGCRGLDVVDGGLQIFHDRIVLILVGSLEVVDHVRVGGLLLGRGLGIVLQNGNGLKIVMYTPQKNYKNENLAGFMFFVKHVQTKQLTSWILFLSASISAEVAAGAARENPTRNTVRMTSCIV